MDRRASRRATKCPKTSTPDDCSTHLQPPTLTFASTRPPAEVAPGVPGRFPGPYNTRLKAGSSTQPSVGYLNGNRLPNMRSSRSGSGVLWLCCQTRRPRFCNRELFWCKTSKHLSCLPLRTRSPCRTFRGALLVELMVPAHCRAGRWRPIIRRSLMNEKEVPLSPKLEIADPTDLSEPAPLPDLSWMPPECQLQQRRPNQRAQRESFVSDPPPVGNPPVPYFG